MEKKIVRPTPKWKFLLATAGALVFLYAGAWVPRGGIALAALAVAFFIDHGRYWNPFVA